MVPLDQQTPGEGLLLTRLQASLTAPVLKRSDRRVLFWFCLSLMFAATYGILGLMDAFKAPYVVQDDARAHVFWMQRFVDPELFPNDLLADYFQSVAPAGYVTLYRGFAWLGVEPLTLNKVLPLVLGLLAAAYCFGVCLEILPVPATAFLSTLLLNQTIWLKDDLISATPRAFLYPLFLAFLYYLLRRSLLSGLASIGLLGLFYPQFLFIVAGILLLWPLDWRRGRPHLGDRGSYLFCAAGLVVAALMLGLFALQASDYGPVIKASEASTLPQFSRLGRTPFFTTDAWHFWVTQERSGILPPKFGPPAIWAALALPVLWALRSRVPLARHVRTGVTLLPLITLVSLGMFLTAHAALFRLHLPARYTEHSLRIVMALAAGIALTLVLDAMLRWAGRGARSVPAPRPLAALGLTALVGSGLILYPGLLRLAGVPFPYTAYRVGAEPTLYEFFARQPKDSLIASLSPEANNLPSFARRPILVGHEYAIPFHLGYYRRFQERATDLIRAQYSPDLRDVESLIRKYGVDFLLIHRSAFSRDYVAENFLMRQFRPLTAEVVASLDRGAIPALAGVLERCAAFRTTTLFVLEAGCVARAAQDG